MASDSRMVALGFGKFARADRIFALERITGEGTQFCFVRLRRRP